MNARRRRSDTDVTPPTPGFNRDPWRPALLLAACVLTYWNSLSVPFVLDDIATLTNSSQIRQWWTLQGLLSPQRASAVAGRPVVELSLALSDALGAHGLRGFHAWNLAIHAACVLLLFGLVRRTLARSVIPERVRQRAVDLGFATALIWAVHPLNSEVVDYVVQRTESTMALCYLATLYASLRAAEAPRPTRWDALAVGACAIGMASKESMATAPLMVVLYDRVFVFGSFARALSARARFYLALGMTWLVLAGVAWTAPRSEAAGFSTGVSPWTYLLNQTVMITRYLELAAWPRSLVAFYGWPRPLTLGDVIPYAVLVVSLAILTTVGLIYRPTLGFLGTWFFVTLAPASSIIPVATEVGAERRMYLPLMALVVMGVIGVVRVWDMLSVRWPPARGTRPARWAAWAALAVVVVALGARTVARNVEYATGLSLARTIVARWPTSVAHQILGEQLLAAGDAAGGVKELLEAVPGDSMARYPLGLELFDQGRLNESIAQLDAFARTWRLPYRLVPHWLEPTVTEVIQARTTAARALTRLKRWPAAVEQSRLILAINPSNADAQALLADALFAENQFDEAATAYRRYADLRPTDANAFTQLGLALISSNKPEDALAAFRRAVEIAPRSWQAQRNLATALFDARDVEGSAVHARVAVGLKPDDATAHDLLGRALAAQGRLAEAATEIDLALQLDPADPQAREDAQAIARRHGIPLASSPGSSGTRN